MMQVQRPLFSQISCPPMAAVNSARMLRFKTCCVYLGCPLENTLSASVGEHTLLPSYLT